MSDSESRLTPDTPLNTNHIDFHPQRNRSNFYTVILKPGAETKPICEVTPDDIIDVVNFHDPNCDLEISDHGNSSDRFCIPE